MRSALPTDRASNDKTSWSYILRSGAAGGMAGCAAKSSVAPLDRIKILFQTRNLDFIKYAGRFSGVVHAGRDIVRTQGVKALFHGHSATLLRIFPYAAIKYMAYDKTHTYLMPTKMHETSARLFMAGSASGVLSVFCTYPLELIRVRLAFETKRRQRRGKLLHTIRTIYTEGPAAAPLSCDVTTRRDAVPPVHEHPGGAFSKAHVPAFFTRSYHPKAAQAGPNVYSHAHPQLLSRLAYTSSMALHTAPKVSFLQQPMTLAPPRARGGWVSRTLHALPFRRRNTDPDLLRRFPVFKFYRGFGVTVLGMIPYAGTAFLVFGQTKNAMHSYFAPHHRRSYQPSKTTLDLLAGTLAGAVSQTAAYPFEVIRRRQQVGGKVRPDALMGIGETTTWIYRTSGVRGFYVGLSIGMLKVMPMTAVR